MANSNNDQIDTLEEDSRISSAKAGYMELKGAKKDGDCHIVEVAGGISQERGCCNKFQPEDDEVKFFRCGTCEYVKKEKPNG